jgi:hypothetical protein
MISKMFRITLTIAVASLALGSAAGAMAESRFRPCSNASLSGTYGFLHGGRDSHGAPAAAVTQATFDSTTGTYTGEDTENIDGVMVPSSVTATYAVAKDCTATARVRLVSGNQAENVDVSLVVTSTGFLFLFQKPGATSSGFGVKQGSPTCTNAGLEGRFGFETTGVLVAGAGPVAFIGELKLTVNPSGEGVISGHIAASKDGTILTFADEPVIGSYSVDANCRGAATITPKGQPEMHFSFVVVDDGKEMLAVERDGDTVVNGTLVKRN